MTISVTDDGRPGGAGTSPDSAAPARDSAATGPGAAAAPSPQPPPLQPPANLRPLTADEAALVRTLASAELLAITREAELVTEVGPFVAYFHRKDPMVWLSGIAAVRSAPFAESVAALREVRTLFERRGRTMRCEYFAGLHPDLAPALAAVDMVQYGVRPLMTCVPGELRDRRVEGLEVRTPWADDAADVAAVHGIHSAVFAVDVSADLAADNTRQIREGHLRYGLGVLDGRPAGAAVLVTVGRAAMLAGVATMPDMRRRGVAQAVCARLGREWFDGGGELLWLTAADEVVQRVYEGIGFRPLPTVQIDWVAAGHAILAGRTEAT